MKIGINGFEAIIPRFGYDKNNHPKRVGSSEVCFELISNFAKIDKKNEYIIYLPKSPTSDMPEENERFRYKIIPGSKLWTITGLTKELLMRPKLDIFFSPTHYGPLYTPCPEIISVLDVSYKHYPAMFNKKDLMQLYFWGGYSVLKSKKIITISNSSKDDIIKWYRVSPDKVFVVYPGLKFKSGSDSNMETSKQILKKYGAEKPYILFVGTWQPRKNIVRLIEAFSKLGKESLNLVIIGRKGWDYEEIISAPNRFGVSSKVLFLEDVSDEELPFFYKNAELFVLPSLYEGFGLPVLEAMKYGCPVVTSNISSLPEAGGEAAVYFNPKSTDDIAEKIEKVLKDEKLRKKMISDGFDQVKKFSWEKSAKEMLSIFEEVAAK